MSKRQKYKYTKYKNTKRHKDKRTKEQKDKKTNDKNTKRQRKTKKTFLLFHEPEYCEANSNCHDYI